MRISIVGSGYVGTTVAACLADQGHEVVNIDVEEEVVDSVNSGDSPIHEPGLDELLAEHGGSGLTASTDYGDVVDTDVTFLCLPTPSAQNGSVDLTVMEKGVRQLGVALRENEGYHVVAVKSTVPPGTTEDVVTPLLLQESGMSLGEGLGIVMNPEFLSEGSAVGDFMEPDKIVVGSEQDRAVKVLREIFGDFDAPFFATGVREAELIKYANNAFLASKLSVVNELGNICKLYGVDSYEVMEALGLDSRISPEFMRSGLGWGGSCFPKDVDAARWFARRKEYEPELLDAVVGVNEGQPGRLMDLLEKHVDVEGARIAVLGLAFKPGTDDVRNSRALDVIDLLLRRDAEVVAYDPVAVEYVRPEYPAVEFAGSADEALHGADAAVIATNWPEFEELRFSSMSRKVVVDGRRIEVDENELDVYEGLCW